MPLGLIWVDCPPSVVTAGLVHALEKQARVHIGGKPPAEAPSSVILQADDQEGLSESVERHQQLSEDAPPILVFASHLNLPLAREALRSGASGSSSESTTPKLATPVRATVTSVS